MCKGFCNNECQRQCRRGDKKVYLERNIIDTASSKWNAPAVLVKRQCKENETRASKQWLMVEDCRQLNKAIKDDTFKTPSVSKIIEVISTKNKYYFSVDFCQKYHYLPLRVEDHEKTIFSTGGSTGRLKYLAPRMG
jgi:hypothetical protein